MMPKFSESQVQAAVMAIVERTQREEITFPELMYHRDQVWIRRNLKKHLEPVLAEVTDRIGLDKNKIAAIIAQHEDEVAGYLKEQEAEDQEHFARLTKHYQDGLDNRKAAIENLAAFPPPAPLVYLEQPLIILAWPSGLLKDDHIEAYNSWAKVSWKDVRPFSWANLSASFYFAWQNESDDDVVLKSARAYLTVRGKCSAKTASSVTWKNWASLTLSGLLRAHIGQTTIDSELQPITSCHVESSFGGKDEKYVFRTVVPSIEQEILVPGGTLAIFELAMIPSYGLGLGEINLQFDTYQPYVSSPLLWIEGLRGLFLETFSETLPADDLNWEGYCLVQRIEAVRLYRSGTQVKLTLRASTFTDASIDRIYISQPDPAGQPYDSAADLTAVTSTPFVVPADTAVTLPAVNYTLDAERPLLIAVDFSASPPSGIRATDAVASAYFKLGSEAAQANRAGFTFYPALGLIERIEVT